MRFSPRSPSGRRRAFAALLLLPSAFMLGCAEQPDRTTGPNTEPSLSAAVQDPFAHVIEVQNRNTARLMAQREVVGVGTGLADDGTPAIIVLAKGPQVAAAIPRRVEDVAVQVRVTGEFRAFPPQASKGKPGGGGGGGGGKVDLKKRIRPIPNGASVGNNLECASGTMGAVVVKGGKKYALSNNHVFARENAANIGEVIVQPGRYDNKPICADKSATDRMGVLSDYAPLSFGGGTNSIDAAIAELDAAVAVTCAPPAGTYGALSGGTASATVNLPIQKVGRTSGLTTGTITVINATVTVGYSTGNATFTGQLVTTSSFSRSGDSGSLIVTNTGDGTEDAVGLLFAGTNSGTTIGNPIAPVLTRFGNPSFCAN